MNRKNKCTICGERVFAKSLCTKHYMQKRRHNAILQRTRKDDNKIEIHQNYASMIVYSADGKEKNTVIIDIEDIEKIRKHRWSSNCVEGNYYISTKVRDKKKKFHVIYLNQLVHGKAKKGYLLAYKNKNTLDNRQENIIETTRKTLQQNTKTFKNNTSGVKGVSWNSRDKKWVATIHTKGKTHYLGGFGNIEDAKKARLDGEEKYHKKI